MPLSKVSKAQLPSYIGHAYDVIAKQFWGDTLIFMGLKRNKEFSDHLLEGVFEMLNLTRSSTHVQRNIRRRRIKRVNELPEVTSR